MGKGSFLLVLIGFGAPFLGAMERETKQPRAKPTGRLAKGSVPLTRAGDTIVAGGAGGRATTPMASRVWRAAMDRRDRGPQARARVVPPPSRSAPPLPTSSLPSLPSSAWDTLKLRPAPAPDRVIETTLPTSTSMVELECKMGSPSRVPQPDSATRQGIEPEVFLPAADGWIDLGQRPTPEGAAPSTFKLSLREVGPTITLFNSGSETLTLAWEDPSRTAASQALAAPWPPAPGSLMRHWSPQETRTVAPQHGLRVRPGLGEGPITLVVSRADEEVYAHVVLEAILFVQVLTGSKPPLHL